MLYNARAYYPVMTVLVLDLGLTLDQFILFNAVWAATILLLEVPSGALADTLGRRRLIIVAAILMMGEMALLLFAPAGGGGLLLGMYALNRVLSGTSEAAASGADQALAFDTLVEHKEEHLWDDVLATAMRWRSIGFFIAMTMGALVFDERFLNSIFHADLDRSLTLRFPLAIVFLQSIACFVIALRMREPLREDDSTSSLRERIGAAVRVTLRAAGWVIKTPLAFCIILGGLLIDSIARNFATIGSEYYRLIGLSPWTYGFIGSTVAVFGFFVPSLAKRMAQRFGPITNLAFLAGFVLICLLAVAPGWHLFGVIPAMLMLAVLGWLDFLTSRTLNKLTESKQRATVLSVKGLAFNVGFGAVSIAFGVLMARQLGILEDSKSAFLHVLSIQPVYFLVITAAFFLYCFLTRKKRPA
jgi:MFS family permease